MSELQELWDSLTDKEKNALVATKVMGWHVGKFNDWKNKDGYREGTIETDWDNEGFYPIENIADAWRVMEKWDKYRVEFDGYRFIANVANDDDKEWTLGIAPTAPEAICLAALKAVGA